jgi:hypothetical protein
VNATHAELQAAIAIVERAGVGDLHRARQWLHDLARDGWGGRALEAFAEGFVVAAQRWSR